MKFLKFIPALLTLCIIIGILIGYQYLINIKVLFILSVFLFVCLLIAYFKSLNQFGNYLCFNVFVYLLFILIGITAISIQDISNKENFYSNYLKKENQIYLKIEKRLKPSRYQLKYEAKIINLNHHNSVGKVLLNSTKDSINKPFKIGDIYYTKASFLSIQKPKNPYSFNYANYLKTKQIYHQLIIDAKSLFLVKSENSASQISGKIINRINNNLKKYLFNKNQLAIINALLLGQRQDISKELNTAYQNAGAIHILAVSGLHIGILFIILLFIFSPIKLVFLNNNKGKILQYLFALLFLWLYAFLAGMSASIARSATMFSAIAIGVLINRNSGTINALFISAFILLLIHPLYLFDIGFQLSYLAVFSIIYFNPIFDKLWIPKNKIIRYLFKIFTVSISAQIGILPLSLYYFHQFPALFFVSGLVVLPVLGILLLFGFFVIILAYFDILPNVLANVYSFFIEQLNQFILFISKQENFIFKQLFFSFLMLISTYLLIIVFYRLIKIFSYKRFVFFLVSILCFQLVLIYEKYLRESEKEFIVFNYSKTTMIGIRNDKSLLINHNLDTLLNNIILNQYIIGTGVSKVKTTKKIKNFYTFNKHNILVIDSLGIYQINPLKPDIIILRNSPKINLERLIKIVKPQRVVVDASNFTSYTKYYEQKSDEMNTNFYNTKQNGAFILKR